MILKRFVPVAIIYVFISMSSVAAQTTVFVGRPHVKVSEGGIERLAEPLAASDAVNLECVISEIDGKYYWASRRNTPLLRVDGGGAFITFIAANGAGYVRVTKSDMKNLAGVMGAAESKFDYVEHVIEGLRTITYFGTRR